MSAYIIFNYKIIDSIKIEEIRGLLAPILEKYDQYAGQIIVAFRILDIYLENANYSDALTILD